MDYFATTHIGNKRNENEDSLCVFENNGDIIAVVADGMGGHNAGKTASEMVVSHIKDGLINAEDYSAETLCKLINDASSSVTEKANENPNLHKMGSTLILAIIQKEKVIIANVGDSRAYVLGEKLVQISKDHSYVQILVDSGLLTKEEAETHPYKNMITRAIGRGEVEADIYEIPTHGIKYVLLCSDGLIRHVGDTEIEMVLKKEVIAEYKALLLQNWAVERGGDDNISIIVLSIGGETK